MRVVNISSGSEGNMTYIESDEAKILVDLGITCKQAEEKLEFLGINPREISCILITHEHVDHIKGVDAFSHKYDTPVFAHHEVWYGLDAKLKKVSLMNRKMFDGDKFGFRDHTHTGRLLSQIQSVSSSRNACLTILSSNE